MGTLKRQKNSRLLKMHQGNGQDQSVIFNFQLSIFKSFNSLSLSLNDFRFCFGFVRQLADSNLNNGV